MTKKKLEIIGIIIVKAKSERVKDKNLRKFSNTTLFELKLKQLKTKILKTFCIIRK